MGFISKGRTKALVAAQSYPSAFEHPAWAAVELGRVVRAAAAAGIDGNTRSSGFRGSDLLGIGSAMRSGDSSVWVENPGPSEWSITLGLGLVKGRAVDWKMTIDLLAGEGSPPVHVATPEYLTSDGALTQRDAYAQTRDIIQTGVTAGRAPRIEPEADAGFNGMAVTPFPLVDSAFALPVTAQSQLVTVLPRETVEELFLGIPFRRAVRGGNDRWTFGLEGNSWIDVTCAATGDGTTVDFVAELRPGRSQAESATTILQARWFVTLVVARIRRGDADAALTGDPELAVAGS